jgi:hypothetical protein
MSLYDAAEALSYHGAMWIRVFIPCVLAMSACTPTSECGKDIEEFSMREPLTDDEWAQISDDWGDEATAETRCQWACQTAYERVTDWALLEATSCSLDVDSWGDTADPMTAAAVVCSGFGTEELCDG